MAVRGHDARLIGTPSCERCLTHPARTSGAVTIFEIILHAFYSFAVSFCSSGDADRGMAALEKRIELVGEGVGCGLVDGGYHGWYAQYPCDQLPVTPGHMPTEIR